MYLQIAHEMEYSIWKDQLSTFLMSYLILNRELTFRELKKRYFGSNVLVFGAGPSLVKDIEKLCESNLFDEFTTITADGATSALLEFDLLPDIFVSDLDGNVRDLLKAANLGVVPVIHAHGDNIPRLLQYVPQFEKVLGTTQTLPTCNIHNFGGFTDGDRCVFLADVLGAKSIVLLGMDFGKEIGAFSRYQGDPFIKRKKLRIGKSLLEWLARTSNTKMYNLTSQGVEIHGIEHINIKELRQIAPHD